MGEIADMMINGLMCEGCGELMDDMDEPGYARRCSGCSPSKRAQPATKSHRCQMCGKRFGHVMSLSQHMTDKHGAP